MVADDLAERFGLPLWRFANSGTEATMDAVHLMRAATGRDRILKVEGCYHGHHDSVEVSVLPEPDDPIGPADRPRGVPDNTGIPARDHGPGDAWCRSTTSPPSSGRCAEHRGEVAGMILEPIMMNAGIIHPDDGYLAGAAGPAAPPRRAAGFDEVKTGLTVGPGGVTRRSASTPDLVCLAKAMGGGLSDGRDRGQRAT